MATDLYWDDTEDLGLLLAEKFPKLNPLEIRFTDLHQMITELPTFVDDPKSSNEGKLEAIQMAWYEEYEDRRKGIA
jgi:FeS assembly protein IscX